MDTTTASTRTQGLLALFDLQTGFLARALEGVSEEDAYKRLDTKANHIAWLAGLLVQQRFNMVKETNPGLHQVGEELFENNKGLVEGAKYPSLVEYVQDWEKVSPLARKALPISAMKSWTAPLIWAL